MTSSPTSDLTSLTDGTRFLTRHPWTTLVLAALGTALGALAPLLQLRAGLPDELTVSALLLFATTFPLQLYFIPRFLMEADAEAGGNPCNAAADWRAHFEERMLRSFASKMLLGAAVFLGLICLILPGLILLLAFGWVPTRVLLKGESLLEAAKGSLRMMAVAWRRMVFTVAALSLVYVTLGLLVSMLVASVLPEPTLQQRLLHPVQWLGNFAASLISLWLSACFLALFRRLEEPPVVS